MFMYHNVSIRAPGCTYLYIDTILAHLALAKSSAHFSHNYALVSCSASRCHVQFPNPWYTARPRICVFHYVIQQNSSIQTPVTGWLLVKFLNPAWCFFPCAATVRPWLHDKVIAYPQPFQTKDPCAQLFGHIWMKLRQGLLRPSIVVTWTAKGLLVGYLKLCYQQQVINTS